MLERITPVILTFNEEANLARTLAKLSWAREILVVDSHSSDGTRAIAESTPRVRLIERPFDEHARQWTFAVSGTGIATEWVLALDADYVLSDALVEEIRALEPGAATDGFEARFIYCVDGKPLRATLYPPVTVLFRRGRAGYVQDGHTQRVVLPGEVRKLRSPVFHDDRKSLTRWVAAQERYARIEAAKFLDPAFVPRRWPEKLRRARVLSPFAMLFYCLFVKRLILDGKAGFFFSFQRAFAELLLSLHLLRHDLDRTRDPRA
jgi:glycosyltransferase involved in cell wall biosynthesis